jgi:hypothetical protein
VVDIPDAALFLSNFGSFRTIFLHEIHRSDSSLKDGRYRVVYDSPEIGPTFNLGTELVPVETHSS